MIDRFEDLIRNKYLPVIEASFLTNTGGYLDSIFHLSLRRLGFKAPAFGCTAGLSPVIDRKLRCPDDVIQKVGDEVVSCRVARINISPNAVISFRGCSKLQAMTYLYTRVSACNSTHFFHLQTSTESHQHRFSGRDQQVQRCLFSNLPRHISKSMALTERLRPLSQLHVRK